MMTNRIATEPPANNKPMKIVLVGPNALVASEMVCPNPFEINLGKYKNPPSNPVLNESQ
jgi:hypothetical protein